MTNDTELNTLIREMHSMVRVLDERSQSILRQAEKTNGRVNKLEENMDDVKQVQQGLVVKVGAFVSLIVLGITTALNHFIK